MRGRTRPARVEDARAYLSMAQEFVMVAKESAKQQPYILWNWIEPYNRIYGNKLCHKSLKPSSN